MGLVEHVASVLQQHCFKQEERPTPTRFFTFGMCIHMLLRMVVLELPLHIVLPASREDESGRRCQAFLQFWNMDGTATLLKELSLAMQLAVRCTALSSRKRLIDGLQILSGLDKEKCSGSLARNAVVCLHSLGLSAHNAQLVTPHIRVQ